MDGYLRPDQFLDHLTVIKRSLIVNCNHEIIMDIGQRSLCIYFQRVLPSKVVDEALAQCVLDQQVVDKSPKGRILNLPEWHCRVHVSAALYEIHGYP